MPVVGAPLYSVSGPQPKLPQNMPLAHSIANPIWFLISYYSNLAQIYCITTTTENPQPTNFIHDRFATVKLQPSMDITAGTKAWRIILADLISKCLFVFLPLDMCSGNINVPANNLRTRSLIVIYDNYMISFLQRGCFV